MNEQILDKDGLLTPYGRKHLEAFFSERGVLKRDCCKNPSWTHFFLFGTAALTINSQGRPVIATSQGVPTVTVHCINCGEVRQFLASVVFPEWVAENKRTEVDS